MARARNSRRRLPRATPWLTPLRRRGCTSSARSVSEYFGGTTTANVLVDVTAASHVDDAHLLVALRLLRPGRNLHGHGGRPGRPDGHRRVLRRGCCAGRSDRHRHAQRGERPERGHLQHVFTGGERQSIHDHGRLRRRCQQLRQHLELRQPDDHQGDAAIVVTPYSVTLDGNPHTATGTATGVESPTPADLSSLLNLSGTTHTTCRHLHRHLDVRGQRELQQRQRHHHRCHRPQPLTVASIAAVSPNPRNTAVSSINVTFSVPINPSSLTAVRCR